VKREILPICVVQLAATVFAGPKTSVETFFAEHVDTSIPALSGIPALMEAGNVAGAEKVFADYVRGHLLAEKVNGDWMARKYSAAAASNLSARAHAVMDYNLVSCGTSYHFADHKVDWTSNHTHNQYKEWTWQLNRFDCVVPLGEYYQMTGDEEAAAVWVALMESWFDQAIVPEKASAYETKCWRTLDAACRIGNWSRLFAAFARSPKVSDAFITRYGISMWEHGWRLRNNATNGNWLLAELSALLRISVLQPFLKDAPEWRDYAQRRKQGEMTRQIYPDGFQYELTTAYHGCVVNEYLGVGRFYALFDLEPPSDLNEKLAKMLEVYERLCRPNWRTPSLNDGEQAHVAYWCAQGAALMPDRADFRWFASFGREGAPPDFLSSAMPYAGAITFRDAWRRDAVWAYLDASPFGRGHQHEDKLNFLLDAYGKTMLIEGGNYFYDTSAMRQYALSTRAHNTVRIDGLDQNTRKTYRWHDADINKKADFEFVTTPGRDRARASFSAGYGPQLVKVVHDRTVLFLKDVEGLGPFFAVVDRLIPKDESAHTFEIMWHLEVCELTIDGQTFTGDFGKGVGLFSAHSAPDATTTDRKGQKKPFLQGWKPLWISGPHEDQPIPTPIVEGRLQGPRRIVTILYPYRDGKCPIRSVRAADNPADKTFTLVLSDGSERTVDESLPTVQDEDGALDQGKF
jgi:hypothetical protein